MLYLMLGAIIFLLSMGVVSMHVKSDEGKMIFWGGVVMLDGFIAIVIAILYFAFGMSVNV